MKIVVHIGTGKAGSTTVQDSTFQSRATMMQHGVLVPSTAKKKLNHLALAQMLTNPEMTPADQALFDALVADIDRHKPAVLFLSSEYIWRYIDSAARLREVLAPLSNDPELVMYVREPRSYYRSEIQQHLKATEYMIGPYDWSPHYVDRIRVWKQEFGDRLTLVPFERSGLRNGSIIDDIAHRYFPNALGDGAIEPKVSNTSDLAEVTALIQHYILINYQEQDRVFRKDVAALRKGLSRVALKNGLGTKAVLSEAAARTILALNRGEILELRDRWGLTFCDIDYDAIADLAPDGRLISANRFGQVCAIDRAALRRIQMLYLGQIMQNAASDAGALD